MSKQDDHPFLPEHVDEQIETLALLGQSTTRPEARLASDLYRIYDEEHEIAAQVWERLNGHIMHDSWGHVEQKPSRVQTLDRSVQEAQPVKTNARQRPPAKKRWHVLQTIAAILVVVALVVSMGLLFQTRQTLQSSQGSPVPSPSATQTVNGTTATPAPEPPTSVTLRVSAAGIAPTTQSEITIPSGTSVTLTVIPNHSLLPFQTFTMGIYATDPYGFSELQDCTYPQTGTCSYTLAYSSSEGTDYSQGKHTFRAFLGNIGGAILDNSNSITITWS